MSDNHPCGLGCGQRYGVRVRIKARPKEREIDGVSLQSLYPGAVRDVSPLLGSWLIAEEYAVPEMRSSSEDEASDYFTSLDAPLRDRRSRKP
jgi:hypothetical protein